MSSTFLSSKDLLPKHLRGADARLYLDGYQLVPVFIFLAAIFHILPSCSWTRYERNRIANLAAPLKSPVCPRNDFATKLEDLVSHIVLLSGVGARFHTNYIRFIFKSIVIVGILLYAIIHYCDYLNFSAIYEFSSCELDWYFPTVTACEYSSYGPSGTKQFLNYRCILPHNYTTQQPKNYRIGYRLIRKYFSR